MNRLAFAAVIMFAPLTALAQRPDNSMRIEVWGLKDETQEEFEQRHRRVTGMGLEGACMATLKGELGYEDPGVYLFMNLESPDSTSMLISIGDVPAMPVPPTEIENRIVSIPESWRGLREMVGSMRSGINAFEFQIAARVLPAFRQGDTATISRTLASSAAAIAAFGDSLDRGEVDRILTALVEAGNAPVTATVDIYLHSDSLADRKLAALVLRNHLDGPEAIEAFATAVWDPELGGDARHVLTSHLRALSADRADVPGRRSAIPFDGRVLAAMLNHPDPAMCDLALAVLAAAQDEETIATALAGGATTLKHYLGSKLTKHSQYARDFRQEAIDALRRISSDDLGESSEPWIAWIDSFSNRKQGAK